MSLFFWIIRYHSCRTSASRSNLTFKCTNTGFSRIKIYHRADTIISKAQIGLLKPMLLKLLRDQMIFCNMKLLFVSVAVDLNNIHSVKQRTRYS